MKVRLGIILSLIVVLAVPGVAFSWGWGKGKSLCDSPFGTWGGFEAKFDQRLYDSDYFDGSFPNGGIKFEFWLGWFDTEEQRAKITNSVFRVRYTNKSTGSTFLITEPLLYDHGDKPSGEYSMWLGHPDEAVGDWIISVITKRGCYTGSFLIHEGMFEQIAPVAVDPIVSIAGDEIIVNAMPTNGHQYKARIFDDGNIVTDNDMQWAPEAQMLEVRYSADFLGERIRIETRHWNTDWPKLGQPGGQCRSEGMGPGGMARSIVWFKAMPPEADYRVMTQHFQDTPYDNYVIAVGIWGSVVSADIIDGPHIVHTWPQHAHLANRPNPGDVYTIRINYSDGFSEEVTYTVEPGGINDNFGRITEPPDGSTVHDQHFSISWDRAPGIVSGQMIVVFNSMGYQIWIKRFDAHTTNANYNEEDDQTAYLTPGSYSMVLHSYDENGNQASTRSTFEFTLP